MNKESSKREIFKWDGKPKMSETLPLALQHVVAMVAGCITPALIVSGAAKLTEPDKILLIQMSLVMAGISTLIMIYFAAKLPVIIGVSFAYVPTMSAIATSVSERTGDPVYAVSVILGAQIVGAVVAVLFGATVKYIKPFFPPLVTGTVVFVIGLSLYPIAFRYMGGFGNAGVKGWGAPKYWIVALVTLVACFILNNFTKGITKLASVLFAMIIGYVVSIPLGLVNVSGVASASWFQLAKPMHFGVSFDPSVILSFVILFIVNSVQAIGDFSSTTIGGFDREPSTRELKGGIIGYGVTNVLSALMGCLPTATFSQNVGIVATNKVVTRRVFSVAAIIIIIAGIVPKFSAILTSIPYAVIGGATLSVFAMITMNGLKLIAKYPLTFRNCTVVGLAVASGMGFTTVAAENRAARLAAGTNVFFVPQSVYIAFGTAPVVLATIVAVILNLVLKETEADKAKN